MALLEGQYQIGTLVFGNATMFPVSNFDTSGYSVTPGDFQPARSDNLNFGNDYFTPASVSWEMAVLRNKWMPYRAADRGDMTLGQLPGGIRAVDELARQWRADEIRGIYGAVKPIIYRRDGVDRRFYGRPRRFASSARTMKSEWINIVCDYQRADLFTYSEQQYAVVATVPRQLYPLQRFDGNAPAWYELYIQGPITNPIVNINGQETVITTTVAAGQLLVLSSYPWDRRIVRSDGLTMRSQLTRPYMDEMLMQPGMNGVMLYDGAGTTSATKVTILWREAYNTL